MRPGSRAGIASRAAACHFQQRQKELQHSTWRRCFGECVDRWKGYQRLPLNLDLRISQFFIQEKPSALTKLFKTDPHSSLQFFLPDLSLFMVLFVMAQCSASEFCSQAFTFVGNRRLLVTTVHLGACRRWGGGGGTMRSKRASWWLFTA